MKSLPIAAAAPALRSAGGAAPRAQSAKPRGRPHDSRWISRKASGWREPLRRLPRRRRHQHITPAAEPGRPALGLSLPRDEGLSGRCRGDDAMNGAITFLSDDALINVAAYYASLDPAPPASAGRARPSFDPVQAGKAGRGGLRRVSRRNRHQQDAGHPEPGRPGAEIPRRGHDGLQDGRAQERYHEGDDGVADEPWTISRCSTRCKNRRAPNPGGRRCRRGPGAAAPAPPATALTASAAIRPRRAWPVRTRSTGGRAGRLQGRLAQQHHDEGWSASLNDTAIKNLAAFYAAQEPQAPNVRKPLTTPQWAERCDRCHGVNGNSTDPRIADARRPARGLSGEGAGRPTARARASSPKWPPCPMC